MKEKMLNQRAIHNFESIPIATFHFYIPNDVDRYKHDMKRMVVGQCN